MAIKLKEVQITLRIPGELAKALDKHAESTRTTRSWVIRDALHRYFDGGDGHGKDGHGRDGHSGDGHGRDGHSSDGKSSDGKLKHSRF
jgi:hypothetical protein